MTITRRALCASLLALCALTYSTAAFAQETAALRFYIVPKFVDTTGMPRTVPKYIGTLGVSWSAMDYGLEDTFLVGADVTPTQHTALAANLDVIAIPQNIDNTIGLTALQTVQDKLEALHIPGQWVTTNHTYRDVLRVVGKIFFFAQRYHGLHKALIFPAGITLNTQINQLTQTQRDRLTAVADSLGLDYSGVTNTMTLRQALKLLGDQIPGFRISGEQF